MPDRAAAPAPPSDRDRFQALTAVGAEPAAEPAHRGFRLAELADFLRALPPARFADAVAEAPAAALDPGTLNHLAGAIELAAERRGLAPPAWTARVPPSPVPVFGSELASLRLYLLTRAPVALRRRNLFFDASIDDRV